MNQLKRLIAALERPDGLLHKLSVKRLVQQNETQVRTYCSTALMKMDILDISILYLHKSLRFQLELFFSSWACLFVSCRFVTFCRDRGGTEIVLTIKIIKQILPTEAGFV